MASPGTIDDKKYLRHFLITERDPSFFDEMSRTECYQMNNEKRRIAVIINNEKFGRLKPRPGTEEDTYCMKEALENLRFEVTIHKNLSVDQMERVFKDIGGKDHTENDCFLAVILTHGSNNDRLYGSDDKKVTVINLMEYLLPCKCPSLIGKPKLFFIQACRGKKYDGGKVVPNVEESKNQTDGIKIPSSWPDVLIHYSTTPGYYAFTNGSGSWFLQSLGAILKQHGRKEELIELLTMVNYRVAYQYESFTENYKTRGKKQMPILSSTLTRQLYFGC